jgi:catechol 2,3-dioxygenase-like lactoylglutathione lyase family enzyme
MKNAYTNLITFVWVKDLERAKKFYTQTLGLSVVFDSQGWVELSIPGTPGTFLALNRWAEAASIPVNEFITFGVADLKDFHARLTRDDVHFKGDFVDFPEEGLKMFKFFDPDGNVLTASQADA